MMPTNCARCRGRMLYERDLVAGTMGACTNCGNVVYVSQMTQEEAEAELEMLKRYRRKPMHQGNLL